MLIAFQLRLRQNLCPRGALLAQEGSGNPTQGCLGLRSCLPRYCSTIGQKSTKTYSKKLEPPSLASYSVWLLKVFRC